MALVPVSECVLDLTVYPRHGLDPFNVAALVEALKSGARFPPVILERVTRRIVDGAHRVESVRRVEGEEALIEAEEREYEDDRALFREALVYNSHHGRRLTSYDRTRAVLLARELGITDEETAASLSITRESLDRLVLTRTAISEGERVVPLKLTSKALSGRTITGSQLAANKAAGGMSIAYYIAQVKNGIEGGLVDLSDPELIARLVHLREVIDRRLA